MAVRISVADPKFLNARILLGSDDKAKSAASSAINRALNSAKAEVIRQIPKQYAIKQRQVREKVTVSKAKKNNLSASVTWRGRALNLADFNVRPGRPQPAKRPIIRAMVNRQAGFDEYKGAFLINTKLGIKAYRRTSAAINTKSRYPITGVWGPSLPQLIGAKNITEPVEARAREQLDKRMDHEINRMLAKMSGGAR